MTSPSDKFEIENFVSPGHVYRVDRAKYEAMRDALLAALPSGGLAITGITATGITVSHLWGAVQHCHRNAVSP